MSKSHLSTPSFASLELAPLVQAALRDAGYENPTPIQAGTIPHLLSGRDVLGQAQTGTGKTAAFALPMLSRLDLSRREPQVLVLAPTRELALQVAEEFKKFGAGMQGLNVVPIFGGASYDPQIVALRRGAQIVVGTPGRVMDHLRRGTLKLETITSLVLDEADEMLKMGFVEDVDWILQHTPAQRQVALFSATMPPAIREIAHKHLRNPETVTIEGRQSGAETIRQRMLSIGFHHKFEATARILESEPTDGVLVFVKTKLGTVELAENLAARGFTASALNGDMPQTQRQRMVDQFKSGRIDILVATDVAARGLDVDRVSHVINYDLPRDAEAYVHRIGRTGRAGREGTAILLVTPRERGSAAAIQRATRQTIEPMELPSVEDINRRRIADFKSQILASLAEDDLQLYGEIVDEVAAETGQPPVRVAAALAKLAHGERPLLVGEVPRPAQGHATDRGARSDRGPRPGGFASGSARSPRNSRSNEAMESYRVEVGRQHGVMPGNLVGAIAGESGLEGKSIGRIDIYDDHTLVDLPVGMPVEIFKSLSRVWVSGQQLRISRFTGQSRPSRGPKPAFKAKPKGKAKKSKAFTAK
ncbi:DEAD/DEAH box helicase [Candidatus Laterigemmans baculatus]|uniref:DEAD/DEAH box helicase n=1 Tax=Candidatus Laterigemmans baculatus TaxID=2770505 RepID=UPI0013DC971F|nr:DEAD/DEAH box helicase [Candidatus Laterigemmans baculatus]